MLDWLNSTALTVFGTPTTWAELLGFATAIQARDARRARSETVVA